MRCGADINVYVRVNCADSHLESRVKYFDLSPNTYKTNPITTGLSCTLCLGLISKMLAC